ncbi:transcription repressor OFP13-like [Panicum miliaceum]|uniref:Transcription repressor n=1 Tax=Panicum miliaceum TaxID=4540 RepID=A0A3L6RE83_PANMI|nr:transcription repressor OFP13-like [Panicum miliaceum]
MGRKGLVSIFSRLAVDSAPASSPAAGPAPPPWPWPPCGTNPRTASFRAGAGGGEPCCTTTPGAAGVSRGGPATTGNNKLMVRGAAPGEMYKTVNSVYMDDPAADVDFFSLAGDDDEEEGELLDDVDSFSTTTASEDWSEAVIRSLGRTSTDRFFFDPGPLPASNSILATAAPSPSMKTPQAAEAKTKTVTLPDPEPEDDGDDAKTRQPCAPSKSLAEGSVAVAVDSGDAYGDFRASMEEMVSAHGLRDWAALEELLAWYLRINGKQHHHLIVDAFVDLLLGLASSSPSDTAAETMVVGEVVGGNRRKDPMQIMQCDVWEGMASIVGGELNFVDLILSSASLQNADGRRKDAAAAASIQERRAQNKGQRNQPMALRCCSCRRSGPCPFLLTGAVWAGPSQIQWEGPEETHGLYVGLQLHLIRPRRRSSTCPAST